MSASLASANPASVPSAHPFSAPPLGADQLESVADLAERYGSGALRTTVSQTCSSSIPQQ